MKFILLLKNDIAVAKSTRKSLDGIDLGIYDRYEEVTKDEFDTVEFPAKKINSKWTKTETFPSIVYPKISGCSVSEVDQLRADIDYLALMTGVEL